MAYYNPTFAQNTGFNTNFSQNFGQTVQTPQVSNVVYVNGEEGANNYPVAAGNTVLLLDFNSNHFWIKSTSPNGVLQPMRSFNFEETTPKREPANAADYVTKKELNDLKLYLDNQFNGIRSQLYGSTRKDKSYDKSNAK